MEKGGLDRSVDSATSSKTENLSLSFSLFRRRTNSTRNRSRWPLETRYRFGLDCRLPSRNRDVPWTLDSSLIRVDDEKVDLRGWMRRDATLCDAVPRYTSKLQRACVSVSSFDFFSPSSSQKEQKKARMVRASLP